MLADPSGRRARALRVVARALAVALIVWIVSLALVGLDILPVQRFLLGHSPIGQHPPALRGGDHRAQRPLAGGQRLPGITVVVDDGSTDRTAQIVAELDLDNVRLVRQDNAGKGAALQRGIDSSDSELIAMVAASGNTKLGNRRGMIGRWQFVYRQLMYLARTGEAVVGAPSS